MKTNKYLWSYIAQFLLEKEMFQKKSLQRKTYIYTNFFSSEIVPFMRMWKNTVELDRSQTTTWRTRIACWITKATDTQSEYVILLTLPLQQWLLGRASLLRYTNIAGLVILHISGHTAKLLSKNRIC